MSLARFVSVVEYDGTRYHGFQLQAGFPTVQAELEQAVEKLCGESSRVVSASRTDAGVHARGQVVSFWAKPAMSTMTLTMGLNHYLPRDIAVKATYRMSDDFNVRRDALSREYRYGILNSETRSPFSELFALFMPKKLDVEVMQEACQLIKGEHDFGSFATSVDDGNGMTRHVYEANIVRKREYLLFDVVAGSFVRHQVRNTMGLLIRLGLSKIRIGDFRDIMEAKQPGLAGPTAPAKGLCLERVNYGKPLVYPDESSPARIQSPVGVPW